jgi:hypothetical protein
MRAWLKPSTYIAPQDSWVRLVRQAVVVDAGAEGEACAGGLWHPPETMEDGIVAGQHAVAEVIHEGRTDLCGGIHSIGVSERPQQRIGFGGIARRDTAARGPRVENSRTVARSKKGVPRFALAWRFHGPNSSRPECRVWEWLDGRRDWVGILGRRQFWRGRVGERRGRTGGPDGRVGWDCADRRSFVGKWSPNQKKSGG